MRDRITILQDVKDLYTRSIFKALNDEDDERYIQELFAEYQDRPDYEWENDAHNERFSELLAYFFPPTN